MGQSTEKTSTNLEPRLAGALCYLGWWVTGIIFLAIEKDNNYIRFHAWQSIAVFTAISIIMFILSFIPVIGWILVPLLGIAAFILWLFLMYQAYQMKKFKLPFAGSFAEKQAG